jgi:pyridoxal phosphate enzyme (YggS family)
MPDLVRTIAENLAELRGRIADAAARGGREATDVKLVAITKYVGPEVCRALVEAGARDLGESRPQELWSKTEALQDVDIRWHMVGHLQRNKVRRTLPLVTLIQSIDSHRLLAAIDREAASLGRRVPVLLEVNISGDQTKHGFAPETLKAALPEIAGFENVAVHGLMAMAHRFGGTEVARRDFVAMRELQDDLAETAPEGVSMNELSMGMTDDFEEAVTEGATIVRIGRALYHGIDLTS